LTHEFKGPLTLTYFTVNFSSLAGSLCFVRYLNTVLVEN